MIRRIALVSALVALVACPRPEPPRPVPALAGPARVAVVPFRTGSAAGTTEPADGEKVPGEAGPLAARALGVHLAAAGIAIVDPDRVAGTWSLADTGRYDARAAARVADKIGANAVILGTLSRYHEREGTAWAVKTPASIAYEATLVRVPDGAPLAVDRFEYAQQALSENLLQLPRFVEGGGRWLTREELLDQALARTADRFARTLTVPPAPR